MANARRTETQKVIEYEPEMPLTVYWRTRSFELLQSPIGLVPTFPLFPSCEVISVLT